MSVTPNHPVPPAFQEYGTERLPQAPAFGHGKHGVADLVVGQVDDNPTRLLSDFVKVPYHLTGTLEDDPAEGLITICLQDPTGALAQGDRHSLSVLAREGARAHVTTQSASKVQTMTASYAHQEVSLVAESGAYVEYWPGATILNRDARCLQTTTVEMASDAVVVLKDIIISDGLSEHDPFSFDHYHSRITATVDDSIVCVDAVDLHPAERDLQNPAAAGENQVVGTLYILAPSTDVDTIAEGIHGRLTDREVTAGVSTLRKNSGVIVRILGQRHADVSTALEIAWDEVRTMVLGVGAPTGGRGR